MNLPHGAWVVVLDGTKRLVFENRGNEAATDLRLREAVEAPVPSTAAMGTDRPGRYPAGGGRRETVEQTDFHRLAKEDFAVNAARALNRAAADSVLPHYVLLAAPAALGIVRPKLSADARALMLASAAEDRVNEPVADIERRIAELRLPAAS
jgi:protein required for attachment to host cells